MGGATRHSDAALTLPRPTHSMDHAMPTANPPAHAGIDPNRAATGKIHFPRTRGASRRCRTQPQPLYYLLTATRPEAHMTDDAADRIAGIIAGALLYGSLLLLILLLAPVWLAVIIIGTVGMMLWQARAALLGLTLLGIPIALACWLAG